MSDRKNWRPGLSTSFLPGLTPKTLAETKTAGFELLELSMSREDYFEKYDFAAHPEKLAKVIRQAGLEIWSIHLPFSAELDISRPDTREKTLEIHCALLRAASSVGIRTAVIHPSSEPISDADRPLRMHLCIDGLKQLAEVGETLGVKMAVEDLPRTCLCRSAEETLHVCASVPGLGVTFDTNHMLGCYGDLPRFVRMLGSRIHTLHVSDYDFIDERHTLPGEGKVNWGPVIAALEQVGYEGPWMYEPGKTPGRTVASVGENYRKMILGNE